jgi:hypothetical protein
MPAQQIGPIGLAGIDLETWFLKFDESGTCISPQTKAALLARLATSPRTPVILFSHGWNNEFGDARTLYSAFLTELQRQFQAHGASGEAPLFVGVIWPSTWLSFDTGPEIAAEPDFAAGDADDGFARELAAGLADPVQRQRLYALLETPQLGGQDARELAQLAVQALGSLSGPAAADAANAEALLSGALALGELGNLEPPSQELEEGGTIGDGATAAPRQAGLLDVLDPRKLLRVASVYQMKDRAGTVGTAGVASLVRDILAASAAPLHAVGHSFGAKVILSAIAAAELPPGRQVASALLLQPAISHLCFAADAVGPYGSGGYRGVPARIAGSLLMTYSAHDFALHEMFHRAMRRPVDVGEPRLGGPAPTEAGDPPDVFAALGGYGPRGAGERLAQPLPEPGTPIDLPRDVVPVAFDGTRFARVRSHGDVATPYTAWLLYAQMAR